MFIFKGNDDIPIEPWNFRFKYFYNVTSLSVRHQAPSRYFIPLVPSSYSRATLYADEGVRLMKGLCVWYP